MIHFNNTAIYYWNSSNEGRTWQGFQIDSAIDDASGLDHLDRYGNMQLGPLETAENRFKFGFFPIMMIILVLLTLLLFYKMSKKK